MYQFVRGWGGVAGGIGPLRRTVVPDWRLPGRLLIRALVLAMAFPLALLTVARRCLIYCW